MKDVEWHHPDISDLIETQTMSERKNKMVEFSDAFVFLPGGSGTMEEFFEFFTAKRLGHFSGPLVIINQDDYFQPLLKLLEHMFENHFLGEKHKEIYSVCQHVDDVLKTLEEAPKWPENAISFAGIH